jgi:hypothetical protein
VTRALLAGSLLPLFLVLGGCSGNTSGETSKTEQAQSSSQTEVLRWEDLMPEGEDEVLAELYAEFYEDQEMRMIEQMNLAQAARENTDIMSLIEEGSAADSMEQIGTYNVVDDLDGKSIRLPGYVVPLDFNAESEYQEFLLVPYFGACLHTPPPPPNQIVFVKSEEATKITDIYEPVWVEGVMKTGKFGSDLGNSAYELSLSKLEPYVY